MTDHTPYYELVAYAREKGLDIKQGETIADVKVDLWIPAIKTVVLFSDNAANRTALFKELGKIQILQFTPH